MARQFSFAGHPSSAFPKDTAEATFWANWSTTALGAFPTAFHWRNGKFAFFCERRTIAARIHSFANAMIEYAFYAHAPSTHMGNGGRGRTNTTEVIFYQT